MRFDLLGPTKTGVPNPRMSQKTPEIAIALSNGFSFPLLLSTEITLQLALIAKERNWSKINGCQNF